MTDVDAWRYELLVESDDVSVHRKGRSLIFNDKDNDQAVTVHEDTVVKALEQLMYKNGNSLRWRGEL